MLLILDHDDDLDLGAIRELIAVRVRGVPKLRQRLVAAPIGCGRPIWVDDASFEVDRHLTAVDCPSPGGERELLDLVAALVVEPLAHDRPLWRAALITDLADDRFGLLIVVDHVMVDGVGGLAALARLVDGATAGPERPFPRGVPSRRALLIDAWHARLRSLLRMGQGLRRATPALRQLSGGLPGRAPRCTFNRPTGSTRRLGVAHADLEALRATAHAAGGTINDLVLAVVTGVLHEHLLERGQAPDRLVVSVPVAAHRAESDERYGNHSTVVPLSLPTTGDTRSRTAEVARITGALRGEQPAAAGSVLAPAVQLLAALGVIGWYLDRQRRVNTFVTNLRGPATPLRLFGHPVTEMVAVNAISGNVTVAFGALSYAGTLRVTVVTDDHHGPDVERLTARLQRQLDRSTGAPRCTRTPR